MRSISPVDLKRPFPYLSPSFLCDQNYATRHLILVEIKVIKVIKKKLLDLIESNLIIT